MSYPGTTTGTLVKARGRPESWDNLQRLCASLQLQIVELLRWSELIWSDPTWLKDDSEKCSPISQIFAVGKYLKVPLAGHHTCTTAGWHPASRDLHLGMAERQACHQPVAVTIHTKSLQIVGGTFPVLAM